MIWSLRKRRVTKVVVLKQERLVCFGQLRTVDNVRPCILEIGEVLPEICTVKMFMVHEWRNTIKTQLTITEF